MINRDEWLKMAREAGFEVCKDRKGIEQAWVDGVVVTPDVEAMLNAILERAAVECDKIYKSTIHKTECADAEDAAKSIRALKTQGE